MTNALLRVDNVTVRFGGIVALDNLSLDVISGSIQAVIGPNGAGKSTMLNVITGLYTVDSGSVLFEREKSTAGRLIRLPDWESHEPFRIPNCLVR